MAISQEQKAQAFARLHEMPGVFAIPNPWDVGSARMLEAMGFAALATTSSGFAQSIGRVDGQVTLEEKLKHCRALADATDLPINADLENGFGHAPKAVAQCIQRAAEAGVVGASVEDYTGDDQNPIYDYGLAEERVAAAVEAARAQPFKFTVTARAENQLRGPDDLEETIKRLQAYERAGADVLYAPALKSLEEIRLVSASVSRPLNVLGSPLIQHTLAELGDAGAKRVSVGGALARLIARTLIDAGTALHDRGDLTWAANAAPSAEVDKLLTRSTAD